MQMQQQPSGMQQQQQQQPSSMQQQQQPPSMQLQQQQPPSMQQQPSSMQQQQQPNGMQMQTSMQMQHSMAMQNTGNMLHSSSIAMVLANGGTASSEMALGAAAASSLHQQQQPQQMMPPPQQQQQRMMQHPQQHPQPAVPQAHSTPLSFNIGTASQQMAMAGSIHSMSVGMQNAASGMQMSQPSSQVHQVQMMPQAYGHDLPGMKAATEQAAAASAAQMSQFAHQAEVMHNMAAQSQQAQYSQADSHHLGMAAVSQQMQLVQAAEQVVPQVPMPSSLTSMQASQHDLSGSAQGGQYPQQQQQHMLQIQMQQAAVAHSAHSQQAASAAAAHEHHSAAAQVAHQQNEMAAKAAHQQQAAAAQAAHQHHSAAAQALQQQHAQAAQAAAQNGTAQMQQAQAQAQHAQQAQAQQHHQAQMMYGGEQQQTAVQGMGGMAHSLQGQMARHGSNSHSNPHSMEAGPGTTQMAAAAAALGLSSMVHAASAPHLSRHNSQNSLSGSQHGQLPPSASQSSMQGMMAAHQQMQPGQALAQQQQQQQQAAAAVQAMAASGILPSPQMVMNAVGPQQQAAVQAAAAVAAAAARDGMPPNAAMAAALGQDPQSVLPALAANMQRHGGMPPAAKNSKSMVLPPQKYRGVTYDVTSGQYLAAIGDASGGKQRTIGLFGTEEEAALAWDREATNTFGPNCILNFPMSAVPAGAQVSAMPPPAKPSDSSKLEPYRSSKFRGVSRGRGKKKWRAMIQHQKKQIHVGYYDSGTEAARAYDREAIKLLGADAVTNFPVSDYENEEGVVEDLRLDKDGNDFDGEDEYDDDVSESEEGKEQSNARSEVSSVAGEPEETPPRAKTYEELLKELGRQELWGVQKEGDQFRAQITIDLGTFPSAEEAALAHDRAAVWTLGIMASTNLEKRKQLLGHGTCLTTAEPRTTGAEAAGAGAEVGSAAEPPTKRAKNGATQYRGVSSPDGGETWQAIVKFPGINKEFSGFKSAEEAARCYDQHLVLLWGIQARTNFPIMDLLGTGAEVTDLTVQALTSRGPPADAVKPEPAAMAEVGSMPPPPPVPVAAAATTEPPAEGRVEMPAESPFEAEAVAGEGDNAGATGDGGAPQADPMLGAGSSNAMGA